MPTPERVSFRWKLNEEQFAEQQGIEAENAGQNPNDWARDRLKEILSSDSTPSSGSPEFDEILLSLQEIQFQIAKNSTHEWGRLVGQIIARLQTIDQKIADSAPSPKLLLSLQKIQTKIANQPTHELENSLNKISQRLGEIEKRQNQLQERLMMAFAAVLAEAGKVDPTAARIWAEQQFK